MFFCRIKQSTNNSKKKDNTIYIGRIFVWNKTVFNTRFASYINAGVEPVYYYIL